MSFKPHVQIDMCSRRRADKKLGGNRCCSYDRLLSIGDSKGGGHNSKTTHVNLKLNFDNAMRRRRGKVPSSEDDIRAIINFAMAFRQGDMVLIHSGDGRCRATAAAMICYRAVTPLTDGQAVAKVLKEFRSAAPNELMLKIADKLLGSKLRAEYQKQRAHNDS